MFFVFAFFHIATDKYRAGYTDCAREVAKYLSTPEPPPLPSVPSINDPGCKTRLLRHLDQCILEIDTEICPATNLITNTTAAVVAATASTTPQPTEQKTPDYFGVKKR